MDMSDKAVKMFCMVRDTIDKVKYPSAFRRAFKKPLSFYLEHSAEEAISILIAECENQS